jgi:glycerol uptake facilitator-like aquaporin
MWFVFAEYLGTLILISVIARVGNPFAIGAALTAAILMLGRHSGGHFNPAVTLWALLTQKISTQRAGMHVAAQLAAAATVWSFV